MEDIMEMNVFAWICTVFTYLTIDCAIRYPKIGKLHYKKTYEEEAFGGCI